MPAAIPEPHDEQSPSADWRVDGLPGGLDYAALVEGLAASGALGGAEDQDTEFEEWRAAEAEGRLEPADPAKIAAQAVEHLEPGPAQAGWLGVAAAASGRLDECGLVGMAVAARHLASWAQACELSAVANLTARAAEADRSIGLAADGRPARVCRDALGQIELALKLTHNQAEAWADLAVTLAWRLPATGRALAGGAIDLDRVQLIAAATSVLTQDQARAVEEKILPAAGGLTRPYLQERLARAVIDADPEGAERRREQAERQADVRLYADNDQTATITGSKLSQVHAAAALARLTALARACKLAGMPGSLGFHRAQAMIGLILGTLPPTPPAEGAPPDRPPPDDDPAGDPGPADDGRPEDSARTGGEPGTEAETGGDSDGPAETSGGRGAGPHEPDPRDDAPDPRDEDAPADDGLEDDGAGPVEDRRWDPAEDDDDPFGVTPAPAWPGLGAIPPGLAGRPGGPADGRPVPGLLDAIIPWTTLAGLSDRSGTLGRIGPVTAAQARQLAEAAEQDPAAQWRVIVTDSAGQALAVARIRRPRRRARLGVGTARHGSGAYRDSPPPRPGAGLVGRITVTITADAITAARRRAGEPCGPGPRGMVGPLSVRTAEPGPPAETGPSPSTGPPPMPGLAPSAAGAALRVGARALDRALQRAEADAAAGGCAHADESPGYRPPPRLREYVIARDVTCRSLVCRQPAWRADLDHTRPYDQHGRTCSCNLGGGCRRDHQLKQHPRWKLVQDRPGFFTWVTPAGRTFTVGPDRYPV